MAYVSTPRDEEAAAGFPQKRAVAEEQARAMVEGRADGIAVEVHVPVGAETPADAILRVAEDEGADLIVIGMRRRSRVGKLVLGSNARDILLGSHAPVLSVKAAGTA